MNLALAEPLRQRADYTHKYNLKTGRHGWLRLTPAYSVRVVEELMDSTQGSLRVLDPFCGTATTAQVRRITAITRRRLTLTRFLCGSDRPRPPITRKRPFPARVTCVYVCASRCKSRARRGTPCPLRLTILKMVEPCRVGFPVPFAEGYQSISRSRIARADPSKNRFLSQPHCIIECRV